ncbi:protein of unknown function [Burkholderia multivorans]
MKNYFIGSMPGYRAADPAKCTATNPVFQLFFVCNSGSRRGAHHEWFLGARRRRRSLALYPSFETNGVPIEQICQRLLKQWRLAVRSDTVYLYSNSD